VATNPDGKNPCFGPRIVPRADEPPFTGSISPAEQSLGACELWQFSFWTVIVMFASECGATMCCTKHNELNELITPPYCRRRCRAKQKENSERQAPVAI
jgi:hypothetical protein